MTYYQKTKYEELKHKYDFKTLKLKAPYSDGDFISKYFNLSLSRKTFIKKSRAKGEFKSLWETKSSDVCGI